jgi:hypothetical protein
LIGEPATTWVRERTIRVDSFGDAGRRPRLWFGTVVTVPTSGWRED